MNRTIALVFLLGAWCGGTVFMWMVATQNFRVVESILKSSGPEFSDATAAWEPATLRLVLRHQASEVNRLFFHGWGLLQPLIGLAALLLASRSGSGKWLVGTIAAMLLISVVLQIHVVPETIRLGRVLDFVPRDPAPPQAAAFWRLHHTYTALDMLKFLLGLGAVFALVRRPPAHPGDSGPIG